MALETLGDVEILDGFNVVHYPQEKDAYNPSHGNNFVIVNDDENSILFKIQNGPIKENGVNGCQIDTILFAARAIISGLNKNFFSYYNERALYHLEEAIVAMKERKQDREKRGVEGQNRE